MALTANEWAAQIAKQVGQGVAHYRGQARDVRGGKLTAQALADRCASLGLPMDRTVIAKLEKGTRQTITVGELVVLARALDIPPVQLLFPLGRGAETEIFPGESVDTWEALKWFTGESSGVPGGDAQESMRQDATAVQMYREYDHLVATWRRQKRATLESVEEQAAQGGLELGARYFEVLAESVANSEVAIRRQRSEIRKRGLMPPKLSVDLAHLEAADSPEGQALDLLSPRTNGAT